MGELVTHYRVGTGRAACRRQVPNKRLTREIGETSCADCTLRFYRAGMKALGFSDKDAREAFPRARRFAGPQAARPNTES